MAIPVVTTSHKQEEINVRIALSSFGLNTAAICGVLANIYHESSFNPKAQGDYENGKYTSYGLCQWHDDRKTRLIQYCKNIGQNYTTSAGQILYLVYELQNDYKTVWQTLTTVPNTAQGAYDASYAFCYHFEKPKDRTSRSKARGEFARDTYWKAYSSSASVTTTSNISNKGNLIIQEARKHIGKKYVLGTEGPNTFDCSGFVYYVYKQAVGLNWSRLVAYSQYYYSGARTVSGRDWKAGDLIFFTDTYKTGRNPNISHVAIAIGDGDKIIHSGTNGVEEFSLSASSSLRNKYYGAKRILSDAETGSYSGTGVGSSGIIDYNISQNNTMYNDLLISGARYSEETDRYLNAMLEARDSIEALNSKTTRDDGYLVDLTNGGEFKFIVPEYGVDIDANWDNTNIPGRSVDIISYTSTSSKSVSITLELIAGEGLYKGSGDRIGAMHKDISFVQSLEYPDYSKAIVFPPPVVYLYLSEETQIRGVVQSVSVKYKKPFDLMNRPMIAELSFTVVQISENPPDYSDIRMRRDNSY